MDYFELVEEMALDELVLFQKEAYKISYQLGVLVANKIRESTYETTKEVN